MSKSSRRIQTHDVRFTNPILKPHSYDDKRHNELIQTILKKNPSKLPCCDVVS